MRARKHQGQALVRHSRGVGLGGVDLLSHEPQMLARVIAAVATAYGIDLFAPRHRQQPRFRLARHTARRPFDQRRGERVGERVLGACDVARA